MQAVNIEHKKFFDSSSMEKQDQLLKKVENIASNQDYSDDDYEKCVRLAHTVNKKYSANVPANFINQPTQNQQDYQRIIALGHDVNKRYSAKHKNLFFPKVINVEEKIKESIKEKDKKGPQAIDYFSVIPYKKPNAIALSLIPQSIHNGDELLSVLGAINNFVTNHKHRELFESEEFLKLFKAKLSHAIAADTIFNDALEKLKKTQVLKCLKIVEALQEIENKIANHIVEIKEGKSENIRQFIKDGFDPNFIINHKDPYLPIVFQNNLLSYVDFKNNPELAIELLEKGVNPNGANLLRKQFFMPPPTWELFNGSRYIIYKKLFKLLIEKGLDPNHKFKLCENFYPTLLGIVGFYFDYDMELLEILLKKGADPQLEYYIESSIKTTPWKNAELNKREKVLALFRKYQKSE